jgi:hypothetical protein
MYVDLDCSCPWDDSGEDQRSSSVLYGWHKYAGEIISAAGMSGSELASCSMQVW